MVRLVILACLLVGVQLHANLASAQNPHIETLAVAEDITIASGTNFTSGGVGLDEDGMEGMGTINVNVPLGATVKQVLLYWEGRDPSLFDDELVVNGTTVSGSGAPYFVTHVGTAALNQFLKAFTLRADITSLNAVGPGANAVDISGYDQFVNKRDGASIVVIYEDASGTGDIFINDGADFAWKGARLIQPGNDPIERVTVPQTYTFAAASVERTAKLILAVGDTTPTRPDRLLILVDGVEFLNQTNFFVGLSGAQWSNREVDVTIPAGATSVTVQIFSEGAFAESLIWVVGGLAVPPPFDVACVECGFGADDADKVSELRLKYTPDGPDPATIVVYNDDKQGEVQNRLFTGMLNPNQEFIIKASDIGRSEFSSKVGFYRVEGGVEVKIGLIHTSCSDVLGPGTTEANQEKGQDPNGHPDFLVVSGKDKAGVPLCPIPPPPEPPDCLACGFGADDADKVSELRLKYTPDGPDPATIVVYNDDKRETQNRLFTGMLNPNQEFIIKASDIGRSEFSSKVGFYAVISGAEVKIAEIHTSCSDVLGPNTTEANQEKGEDPNGHPDFLVVSGKDKAGVPLCPIPPPPEPPDCLACGFGADDADKVSELTLKFTGEGPYPATIAVYNDDKQETQNHLVTTLLNQNQEFTIKASDIGRSEFSSKVGFYRVEGSVEVKIAEIHTSCSDVLGPNTTEANQEKGQDPNGHPDFLVVSGKDKAGIPLCEVPPELLLKLFGTGGVDALMPRLQEVPTEFSLEAAYPNPFNPVTTLRYGLPEASDVRLVVYDVLGRRVEVLVDGSMPAGMHTAQFDARGLPSGTYFYRIDTAFGAVTRTMVLAK